MKFKTMVLGSVTLGCLFGYAQIPTNGISNGIVDTSKAPKDSIKILAAATSRHFYMGAYMGIAFFQLDRQGYFSSYLDSLRRLEKRKALQEYESVHLCFPIGVYAAMPISRSLDILMTTKSFWYKQTALSEDSSHHSFENWYAVQGNILGFGLKYYVPTPIFSVNQQIGLFASITPFWNLGFSEIYSTTGDIAAPISLYPIGYEIQLGFQHDASKNISWQGTLAFNQFTFESDKTWNAILPYGANNATNNRARNEKANWSLTGLEFQFKILWTPNISQNKNGAVAPLKPMNPDSK
jgi:hypothetical protein